MTERSTLVPAPGLRPSRAPWLGGLSACLLWSSMLLVVFRFPDLGSQAGVVAYWDERNTLTQSVIVVMACGYPGLVLFLSGMTSLWPDDDRSWRQATAVLGYMFVTALMVALGMASAAGQLIVSGPAHHSVGYGLHTAAFVLAAPAAALGAGFFAGAGVLSLRDRSSSWLAVPAAAGVLCNLGPFGAHFALTGPWNAGNGILGGMTLPVASLLLYAACVSAAQLRAVPTGARPSGAASGG